MGHSPPSVVSTGELAKAQVFTLMQGKAESARQFSLHPPDLVRLSD